jgi:hypothetical protein
MSETAINPRILELLRFTKVHNRHREALARATGENFNIFKILGIGHREVTTHSPVLAELLNPEGKHGQGAIFLRLFLAEFEIQDFDAETAKLRREHFIGRNTEESGGRLDILLNDRLGKTILIENKIGAGDQSKQMERYRNYSQNAHLFYLSLDGHEPANLSPEKLKDINCRCISYEKGILAWLKKCHKEAASLATVRETIAQYIHLIAELTNQSTSIHMSRDLIDQIIKDRETYLACISLRNEQGNINQAVIEKFNSLLDALGQELGLETLERFKGDGRKGDNYFYATPALKAQNLKFGFRSGPDDYKVIGFGFAYLDSPKVMPLNTPIIANFKATFGGRFQSCGFWHAYTWDCHPFTGGDPLADILSSEFTPALSEVVRTLVKIGNNTSTPLPSQTT